MLRWEHKVIELSELNDAYDGVVFLQDLQFVGSGLTPGQRFELVDGLGARITRHDVINATEDLLLIVEPVSFRGFRVSSSPDGGWSVFMRIR